MLINQFHANIPLPYPGKTLKKQRSSDVFRGYRSGILTWNGLWIQNINKNCILVLKPEPGESATFEIKLNLFLHAIVSTKKVQLS